MRSEMNRKLLLDVGVCLWAGFNAVLAIFFSAVTVIPAQARFRDYAVLFLLVNASILFAYFASTRMCCGNGSQKGSQRASKKGDQ